MKQLTFSGASKAMILVFMALLFGTQAFGQGLEEHFEVAKSRYHSSKGIHKDGLPVGAWSYYYADGSISAEGSYNDNGQQHGKWLYYYPNGYLEQDVTFADGLPTGEWKIFYSNGQLKQVLTYMDNAFEGAFQTYHGNGAIHIHGQYEAGRPTGKWLYYNAGSGKLYMTETYEAGKLQDTQMHD